MRLGGRTMRLPDLLCSKLKLKLTHNSQSNSAIPTPESGFHRLSISRAAYSWIMGPRPAAYYAQILFPL